ncbi:SIR2 family protein [Nonomuraea harbinensis]|uniref:SIR2 family protein n=1 Tax=Nonomuraea harbinensis TaxID=1286938 RepID=A0ABW1C972_9ACTN|nr:SIR2 family protein [Nonomuraea harbinensis]
MTITERDMLRLYGDAVMAGNAALFVGAGLSQAAGHPGWPQLLEGPRSRAAIPKAVEDLPLAAQYFVQETPGGREALESHILSTLSGVEVRATEGHRLLARLPVDDIWTTNYDCLIEEAIPDATVVADEADLSDRQMAGHRRVMKMHGSLSRELQPGWLSAPVITRRDYEEYEALHPRMWSLLQATFLTRSFLFLGFSFTDPNVEVLLRLSRALRSIGTPEHFTVLRRPSDPENARLHDLRVRDLEDSGIGVCEVLDFDELTPMINRLVRRTRARRLFLSGSDSGQADYLELCRTLGYELAHEPVSLVSLAGTTALEISFAFGGSLIAEERYDPDRVRFYFRPRPQQPTPQLGERIGTAVYTALPKEELRSAVMAESRALLVVGGGETTRDEVFTAIEQGMPIVPVARSGGTALDVWTSTTPETLGFADGGSRDWTLLNHHNVHIATAAAVRLASRAMYLGDR